MASRERILQVGCLVVFSTLVWGSAVAAAEPPPPAKALYLRYCSACHGESGKGDGVVSSFLQPKATDLTKLTKGNHGTFPFVPVMQAIDGTKTIRAHGETNMPVWGESFRREIADSSLQDQVRVRGRLMLITEYIESIQEK